MVQLPHISCPSWQTKTAHRRPHDGRCRKPSEGREGWDHICFRYAFLLVIKLSLTPRPVRKYIEAMKDASQLSDLLSVAGTNELEPTKAVAGRTALYLDVCLPPICYLRKLIIFQYLPSSTLLAGVKAGGLHQGHFNANQYNYLEVSLGIHPTQLKLILYRVVYRCRRLRSRYCS